MGAPKFPRRTAQAVDRSIETGPRLLPDAHGQLRGAAQRAAEKPPARELDQPSFLEGRTTRYRLDRVQHLSAALPGARQRPDRSRERHRLPRNQAEGGVRRAFFSHHLYVTPDYNWQANFPFAYIGRRTAPAGTRLLSRADRRPRFSRRPDRAASRLLSQQHRAGRRLHLRRRRDGREGATGAPHVRSHLEERHLRDASHRRLPLPEQLQPHPARVGQQTPQLARRPSPTTDPGSTSAINTSSSFSSARSTPVVRTRTAAIRFAVSDLRASSVICSPSTAACVVEHQDPPASPARRADRLGSVPGSALSGRRSDRAVALFVDASDVVREIATIRFTFPHLSPGLGLRYATPVGPVRLDVGYRVPYLQKVGCRAAARRRVDPHHLRCAHRHQLRPRGVVLTPRRVAPPPPSPGPFACTRAGPAGALVLSTTFVVALCGGIFLHADLPLGRRLASRLLQRVLSDVDRRHGRRVRRSARLGDARRDRQPLPLRRRGAPGAHAVRRRRSTSPGRRSRGRCSAGRTREPSCSTTCARSARTRTSCSTRRRESPPSPSRFRPERSATSATPTGTESAKLGVFLRENRGSDSAVVHANLGGEGTVKARLSNVRGRLWALAGRVRRGRRPLRARPPRRRDRRARNLHARRPRTGPVRRDISGILRRCRAVRGRVLSRTGTSRSPGTFPAPRRSPCPSSFRAGPLTRPSRDTSKPGVLLRIFTRSSHCGPALRASTLRAPSRSARHRARRSASGEATSTRACSCRRGPRRT